MVGKEVAVNFYINTVEFADSSHESIWLTKHGTEARHGRTDSRTVELRLPLNDDDEGTFIAVSILLHTRPRPNFCCSVFDPILGVFTGVLAYYLYENHPRTNLPPDQRLTSLIMWKRSEWMREREQRLSGRTV
jgi:Non-classical export protein 1